MHVNSKTMRLPEQMTSDCHTNNFNLVPNSDSRANWTGKEQNSQLLALIQLYVNVGYDYHTYTNSTHFYLCAVEGIINGCSKASPWTANCQAKPSLVLCLGRVTNFQVPKSSSSNKGKQTTAEFVSCSEWGSSSGNSGTERNQPVCRHTLRLPFWQEPRVSE